VGLLAISEETFGWTFKACVAGEEGVADWLVVLIIGVCFVVSLVAMARKFS
jgi:hypothetical protein